MKEGRWIGGRGEERNSWRGKVLPGVPIKLGNCVRASPMISILLMLKERIKKGIKSNYIIIKTPPKKKKIKEKKKAGKERKKRKRKRKRNY